MICVNAFLSNVLQRVAISIIYSILSKFRFPFCPFCPFCPFFRKPYKNTLRSSKILFYCMGSLSHPLGVVTQLNDIFHFLPSYFGQKSTLFAYIFDYYQQYLSAMDNANGGQAEQPSNLSNKDQDLDIDSLVENDKNSKWIVCKFCGSKILRPTSAEFIEKEVRYII